MAAFTAVMLFVCAIAPRAPAYPTSLNLMPTADVLDRGSSSLQFEVDAGARALTRDAVGQVYTQFGLTSRLEAGVDLVDATRDSRVTLNAKWQFLPEGRHTPAAAVGFFDLCRCTRFSGGYLVLTRTLGPTRVHGGCVLGDSLQGMLGVDQTLSSRTTVQADWTTGADGYHSLGMTEDLGHELYLTGYYARGNTSGASDFVGLNLCWEHSWTRPAVEEEVALCP